MIKAPPRIFRARAKQHQPNREGFKKEEKSQKKKFCALFSKSIHFCGMFEDIEIQDSNLGKKSYVKFTAEEDAKIVRLVNEKEDWEAIASSLNRTRRQVWDRYYNYLQIPDCKRPFTEEEDQLILDCYSEIGPKFSEIAKILKNRTGPVIGHHYYWLQKHKPEIFSKRDQMLKQREPAETKEEQVHSDAKSEPEIMVTTKTNVIRRHYVLKIPVPISKIATQVQKLLEPIREK